MPNPPKPQNLANHSRLDPIFHFFLAPVVLITFVATVVRAVQQPALWRLWSVVLAVAAFAFLLRLRTYPLKVQDRVIRLEERLRLMSLAPSLADPAAALSESQLIALRFASDAELAELARKAIDSQLSAKQIKQEIKNWRGDYWRV